MKKSLMNIKHFVDSNVRQRIDRAANNNCDFFDEDLLLVERQFEDIRQICLKTEKRISIMLQSTQVSPLGSYTQNVQAGLNNLSHLTTPGGSVSYSNPKTSQLEPTSSGNSNAIPTNDNETSNYNNHHNSQDNKQGLLKSTSNQSSMSQQKPSITSDNCNNISSSKNLNISERITINPNDIRDDIQRHKKLPIVGFLKFLVKTRHKLKDGSLLATTFTHCSQIQTLLTKLYLNYEQTVESQCLKPIQQMLEVDVPNVIKLRKLFIKSHNDLDTIRTKFNGASLKQQQLQQQQTITQGGSGGGVGSFVGGGGSIGGPGHLTSAGSYTINQAYVNKLDHLKKELEDAETKFDQAKDTYAAELYAFVCRECELVNLLRQYYQIQASYHQQVWQIIENSLPPLDDALGSTRRKLVFGVPLSEHLNSTGRQISPVIELSIHLLHSAGLNEEGLFRIPGSSVKIKKLKNAINAWFVSLANQNELEFTSEHSNRSSLITIRDLFRDVLSQKPSPKLGTASNSVGDSDGASFSTIESNLSSSTPSICKGRHQLVNDLHSVAGLLKLYLRELPEHLLTYAFYERWIEATIKTATMEERLVAYEKLLKQLPEANYNNLRHLIRFLHLLTRHRELNKMTATNLAITMAPSLIWAKPPAAVNNDLKSPTGGEQSELEKSLNCSFGGDSAEDAQALNVQMSNVGMSASLHALVIETLITNAERLCPGPIQLNIPGFEEITPNSLHDSNSVLRKQERDAKSNSPTGLSAASDSSFSSSSTDSKSTNSAGVNEGSSDKFRKQHSRKGGSMEGLLGPAAGIVPELSRTGYTSLTRSRPVSAHIQPVQRRVNQPPPVPPAPASRSQRTKNLDEPSSSNTALGTKFRTAVSNYRRQSSSHKAPAPPPPAISDQHQAPADNGSESPLPPQAPNRNAKLAEQSLTSGGIIGPGGSGNVVRPSVPPPDRPVIKTLVSSNPMPSSGDGASSRFTPEESDGKSAHSDTTPFGTLVPVCPTFEPFLQ